MKIIGILGGMSVESTKIYYKLLCDFTAAKLGGLNSPELIIRSINFAEIEKLQKQDKWDEAGAHLNREAQKLEAAGAQILLLATNTMHKVCDEMLANTHLDFIHIAEATASQISASGFKSPALIATKFTMEQDFYTDSLRDAGLNPIIPNAGDRDIIHSVIFDELCKGTIKPESQEKFVQITDSLKSKGADCLILGCTEVCMLLNQNNTSLPLFDTTEIHCRAAFNRAFCS